MNWRKVVSNMRIESNNDQTARYYKLTPAGGGRFCKGVQYMVKVIAKSAGTARVTVRCDHGPDGEVFITHSTPINDVDPGSTVPGLVSGDTLGTPNMIGEVIEPVIGCRSTAAATIDWMVVDLYELRKAF